MRSFNTFTGGIAVIIVSVAMVMPLAARKCAAPVTSVTPHMEAPIVPGWNSVFCSTFQIAWNDMKDGIVGEDIRLEKPLELVLILNRSLSTDADIQEEDYLAMVGYGSDNIADRINEALRAKFGSDAPHVDEQYNEDDVILAYAYLIKELLFESAFEDFTNSMSFYVGNGYSKVRGFGIGKYADESHRRLRDQVEIFDYVNHRDFIVRLKSQHPDDEIILARVKPGKTLLETYRMVDAKIEGSNPELLEEKDTLQIPKFDLSIDHSYSPVVGLFLLNKGFERYFVAEAKQNIRFKLDECGATVRSEAELAIKKGPPVDFKVLVFNVPFMLYLKRKGSAFPYLAIWIGNAELLVKD